MSLDPAGSNRQGVQQQVELVCELLEAKARANEERRRHAEEEARLEAEVQRLKSGSRAQAMTPCTYMYAWGFVCRACGKVTCLGCAGRGRCLHEQAGAGG